MMQVERSIPMKVQKIAVYGDISSTKLFGYNFVLSLDIASVFFITLLQSFSNLNFDNDNNNISMKNIRLNTRFIIS